MLRFPYRILCSACLLALAACDEAGWEADDGDDNTDNNGNTAIVKHYFGPNTVWELSLESVGDFSLNRKDAISDLTPQISIDGSYERLSTGFTRFTVTNPSTGVASQFSGIQLGDDALILMPPETTSQQLLALAPAGNCPTNVVDGVWVKYKFDDSSNSASDSEHFFGSWRYNPNDNTFAIRDDFRLDDMNTTGGGVTFTSENCDKGLVTTDQQNHFLSASYSVISLDRDEPSLNQFRFGLPETEIATTAAFNGSYVGVMYENASNTSTTISAECIDGECTIYAVSDVAQVNTIDSIYTLNLSNSPDEPERGFITGTWANAQTTDSANIACAVVIDIDSDDRDTLACVGQYPAATIADTANLFLVSTD